MDPLVSTWADVAFDHPIDLLHRQKIMGDNMLLAMVRLEKGCHVPVHHHMSEQIACIMSGRVRWTLGEEGRQVEAVGGQVVRLPPNFPHGVDALEETIILDILAPPGPMGVDNHTRD